MPEVFCVEIVGEGGYHNFLNQSGWSGVDYRFIYNRATNSHVRAYRKLEDYMAERVDMHKSSNVWPLMFALHPSDKIDEKCYTTKAPVQIIDPQTTASESETDTVTVSLENGFPTIEYLQSIRTFNQIAKIARDLGVNMEGLDNKAAILEAIEAIRPK